MSIDRPGLDATFNAAAPGRFLLALDRRCTIAEARWQLRRGRSGSRVYRLTPQAWAAAGRPPSPNRIYQLELRCGTGHDDGVHSKPSAEPAVLLVLFEMRRSVSKSPLLPHACARSWANAPSISHAAKNR